jgi:hypothetical protein
MSDPAEVFVPIVAILVIFGLPLSYAIVNRVFAHQERIEMIRRGVMPPPETKWAKRMGSYAVPPAGAYAQGYDPFEYSQWQANRSLRKGITLAMVGFALLVGLSFIDLGTPGPWLLGGLIPLFVGIAQIIIALMSGARFGTFAGCQPPPHLQQPGAGQQQDYQAGSRPFTAPPPNAPSGPYGWRPGPTTELEKPTPPPDIRQ